VIDDSARVGNKTIDKSNKYCPIDGQWEGNKVEGDRLHCPRCEAWFRITMSCYADSPILDRMV